MLQWIYSKAAAGCPLVLELEDTLVDTQVRCPATAHAEPVSLLCFQPEAMLVSLATRTTVPSSGYPCGERTRQGRTLSMPFRS